MTSTSQVLKEKITDNQALIPTLIISDQQSAGYGKNQRHFISNTGGLYFSLALNIPELNTENIGLLTTGIVSQLQQTIFDFFHIQTQIKWVNDLLLQHKKVAGILVELVEPTTAVIGIGLNLYQPNLQQKLATSTNLLSKAPSDSILCNFTASLTKDLINNHNQYLTGQFLPNYKKNLETLNHQVVVQIGNKQITGMAVDINSKGHLIIQTPTEKVILPAGEVTKVR